VADQWHTGTPRRLDDAADINVEGPSPTREDAGVSEDPFLDQIAGEAFAQFRKDIVDTQAVMAAEAAVIEEQARQIAEAQPRRRWWQLKRP
jgi:hypothetical protein